MKEPEVDNLTTIALPLEHRLAYDASAGNGPFGVGWRLSLPAILRRTDRGVPAYVDADGFVWSGEEGVVRRFAREARDVGAYRIDRYEAVGEGEFAELERYTERASRAVHWRVTTPAGAVAIYGRSPLAQLADPARREHVFSWLLEETRDERGNVARYTYRAEDGAGVDRTRASEASRFTDGVFRATAQRYLARIQYGNRGPIEDGAAVEDSAWLYEVVLDYGDAVRLDPCSSYRATFEIRTYRLCRRILMVNRVAEPALVRSLELGYAESPVATYLTSARETGGPALELPSDPARTALGADIIAGVLLPAPLPALEVADPELRLLDLDGDGFPDVIVAEHDAMLWYPSRHRAAKPAAQCGGPAIVFSGDRETFHLADMTGDGLVDLVRVRDGEVCYWPSLGFGRFGAKVTFDRSPRLDATEPFDPARVRFADIEGSGASDLIYLGRDGIRVYANEAGNGWRRSVRSGLNLS